MKVTYDSRADAIYIRFRRTTVTTKHPLEGVAVDVDAEEKIVGIEILDASHHFDGLDVIRQMTFEDITAKQPA